MTKELSILIPTYNYDATPLVRQLQERAEALGFPYEILVLDDGSTSFVKQNSQLDALERVTYRHNAVNLGRSATRNKLVASAGYKNLLFLDADVVPATKGFLEIYFAEMEKERDVICGGIVYSDDPPEAHKMLRYKYGRQRETAGVTAREQHPFIIVTANLLIKKDLFLKANTSLDNFYGEDLLISQNLERNNARVSHIDNPVVHLGIEASEVYLEKSREAIRSIVKMERSGELNDDFMKLQRTYSKFKKNGSLWLVNAFTRIFGKTIERNLLSASPNLKWFDLYRLKYYSDLKKHD